MVILDKANVLLYQVSIWTGYIIPVKIKFGSKNLVKRVIFALLYVIENFNYRESDGSTEGGWSVLRIPTGFG